jgi:1-deoxy-D-xylulose-5-phosphate synthase
MNMVATARAYNEGPIAFRYPRGEGLGLQMPARGEVLQIGKGRVLSEGSDVAILNLGTRLGEVLKTQKLLEELGIGVTIADMRFAKPLDEKLILQLARHHEAVISVEEGSKGGFGAQVLHLLSAQGLLDYGLKIRTLTLPDKFQDQDSPEKMYAQAGLDAKAIAAVIISLVEKKAKRVYSL